MTIADEIRKLFFGPRSKFKVGDSVQLVSGGPLMVVVQVFSSREMPQPMMDCKWYESKTNTTRTNLFSEQELKIFDWYKVQ